MEKFMKNHARIDLLLLDVVMPGKNGIQIFQEFRKIRPDIKVLFTSGYTDKIVTGDGLSKEGLDFISKPAAPEDLFKKIRLILDR